MKKIYYLLNIIVIHFTVGMYSQINYYHGFEVAQNNPWMWQTSNVTISKDVPCSGNYSLLAYPASSPGSYVANSSAISPNLGTSNGQPATLTYSYKLLNWDGTALSNDTD